MKWRKWGVTGVLFAMFSLFILQPSTWVAAQSYSWTGEYFNNPYLQGSPAFTRTDSVLAFDFGNNAPGNGVGNDGFSVRWTALAAFGGGTYRFWALADDNIKITLDDGYTPILNTFGQTQIGQTVSADVPMTAGVHKVRVDYQEVSGNAYAYVTWGPLGTNGPNFPVPQVSYSNVNAVSNALAVITPIELEHAAMLGGTLSSIAHHKAGIIQPQGYAISAPQATEVETVLNQEAASQQATLNFEPIASLAVTACANLMQRQVIPTYPLPITSPPVHLPGRMEQIEYQGKLFLIDGAHTPSSARRLNVAIDQINSVSPVHIIIGMLRDKSARDFLKSFDDPRFHISLTQLSSHRALTLDELGSAVALHDIQMSIQPDLRTAIQQALKGSESLIVITGSLRMAALSREILGLLSDSALEEAQRTRKIFEGQDYLTRLK